MVCVWAVGVWAVYGMWVCGFDMDSGCMGWERNVGVCGFV